MVDGTLLFRRDVNKYPVRLAAFCFPFEVTPSLSCTLATIVIQFVLQDQDAQSSILAVPNWANSWHTADDLLLRVRMRVPSAIFAASAFFLPPSLGIILHGRDINEPLLASYDYIVVGCGISGLVVTNRLSELTDRTVLCIEAGDAYVLHAPTPLLKLSVVGITMRQLFKIRSMWELMLAASTIGTSPLCHNHSWMGTLVQCRKARSLVVAAF